MQSTAGGTCDDEEDDRIGKPGLSGFVELWWVPESFFEASAYKEAQRSGWHFRLGWYVRGVVIVEQNPPVKFLF